MPWAAVLALVACGVVAHATSFRDPITTLARWSVVAAFVTLPWGAVQIGGIPLGDIPLGLSAVLLVITAPSSSRITLPFSYFLGGGLVALSGLLTEVNPPSAAYLDGRFVPSVSYLVTAGVPLRSLANLLSLFKFELSLLLLPLVAALAAAQSARLVRHLAVAWVVGITISNAVATSDHAGLTHISLSLIGVTDIGGRAAGLTPQPNFVGVETVMAMPLVLLAFRRRSWPVRAGALVVLGFAVSGLLAAGSRGAAVAALVAVPVTVVCVPATRAWIGRIVMLGGVGVLVLLATPLGATLIDKVRLQGDPAEVAGSDQTRLQLRLQGFADFAYSPVHGIGWGHASDAHLIYLQLAAAGGSLAVVGFVVYVVNPLVYAWRWMRHETLLAAGLLASTLTWLIVGVVENQLTDQWVYVPLALLIALWSRRSSEPTIQDTISAAQTEVGDVVGTSRVS